MNAFSFFQHVYLIALGGGLFVVALLGLGALWAGWISLGDAWRFVQWLFGKGTNQAPVPTQAPLPINVDFRSQDKGKDVVDLGDDIHATLTNGRGPPCVLKNGTFEGADPRVTKVGAKVKLNIQFGKIRETLPILYDFEHKQHYVKSALTCDEIHDRINGGVTRTKVRQRKPEKV